ncbi:MAG: hypothetical protein ABIC04_08180 [Nanoarchaeota archaeon]
MKKIRIVSKEPCLIISRGAFHSDKVVYICCANKKHKYDRNKSRIVYIGATKRGAKRFSNSVVYKGKNILDRYGINQIKVYTVTCRGVRGTKIWQKLEDAFLYNFLEEYGRIPILNKQCRSKRKKDVSTFFPESRIDEIIDYFSNLKS